MENSCQTFQFGGKNVSMSVVKPNFKYFSGEKAIRTESFYFIVAGHERIKFSLARDQVVKIIETLLYSVIPSLINLLSFRFVLNTNNFK